MERDALTQMAVDDPAEDDWEDETQCILPAGEEGMFLSAAGGEHAIWEEFFKDGHQQYVWTNISCIDS